MIHGEERVATKARDITYESEERRGKRMGERNGGTIARFLIKKGRGCHQAMGTAKGQERLTSSA